MTRTVLVTGATGTLGRDVLPAAVAAGHQVRASSRGEHRDDGMRWHRCDLLTGDGVDDSVEGVDVILHCATQPTGGKDVRSMQNSLTAARRAGVGHVVYISIVGVDRIRCPTTTPSLRPSGCWRTRAWATPCCEQPRFIPGAAESGRIGAVRGLPPA